MAMVTAEVRSTAPNFWKMFVTCALTVPSTIPIREAISLLLSPRAISRSTSSSRSDNCDWMRPRQDDRDLQARIFPRCSSAPSGNAALERSPRWAFPRRTTSRGWTSRRTR